VPLYEYYCRRCDGGFEALRPMREADLPALCPQCGHEGQRIMSGFSAFTMREGYPRRLPDKGSYWHLGKEVKSLTRRTRGHERPGSAEPEPAAKPAKAERSAQRDRRAASVSDLRYRDRWGVDRDGLPLPKTKKLRRRRRTLGS
jgi:putative FmdB family regulatory protein